MQLDSQKIFLLRSYSRSRIISPENCSASGLEKFLPRTSTPRPESALYMDDKNAFDPYEIFRTLVEAPPMKSTVIGLKKIPYTFISGHLVQSKSASLDLSFSNSFHERPPRTLKRKVTVFKKRVKKFFQRYYRKFVRNPCDDDICPAHCECQKVKSLLNKTIVLDDSTMMGN